VRSAVPGVSDLNAALEGAGNARLDHVGQDVTEGLIDLLVDLVLNVLLGVLDLTPVVVMVGVIHPLVKIILTGSIVKRAAVSAVAGLINFVVSGERAAVGADHIPIFTLAVGGLFADILLISQLAVGAEGRITRDVLELAPDSVGAGLRIATHFGHNLDSGDHNRALSDTHDVSLVVAIIAVASVGTVVMVHPLVFDQAVVVALPLVVSSEALVDEIVLLAFACSEQVLVELLQVAITD